MPIDMKTLSTVAAALIAGGAMVFGGMNWLSPEASHQCQVDLADRSARLDLTTKAMDSCSAALNLCSGVAKP